jgi:REP element-mobilizing transposase RayT
MHVVDRVVGRQLLLGEEEKEFLRSLLRGISAFAGLEVITWTCLDNHYHLLLRVPNEAEAARLRAEISEEALLERMKSAFSREYRAETRRRLEQFRREGKPEMAESVLRRLRNQMFDVSAFMHMLKRRFSAWFNQRHGRKGTLWESRFGSVLVEDEPSVVLKMAAYIDLNAVRAGIVKDPKDYRWCGYAEAIAGQSVAREGIMGIVRDSSGDSACGWEEAASAYREWLYDAGCEVRDDSGKLVRKGVTREEVEAVRARGGRLSLGQLLHCRVRYFTDGVAIGSRAYVESVFETYRHGFGPKRATGARPMRWGEWGGLCSLRDLQKDVIRGAGSG